MAEQDVQPPHGPALQSTEWEKLEMVDEKEREGGSFFSSYFFLHFPLTIPLFTFESGCYASKHIDENLPASLKCDLTRNAVMPPTTKSRTTRVAMRLTVVN